MIRHASLKPKIMALLIYLLLASGIFSSQEEVTTESVIENQEVIYNELNIIISDTFQI